MNAAVLAVLITGSLGLTGATVTALLTRRTGRDTTANATIEIALKTQAAQLDRQEKRIEALEDDVTTCHRERDEDRRAYRAELDELRLQIGAK